MKFDASPYIIDTVIGIKVGELVEDFETNDFSSYEWDTVNDYLWSIKEEYNNSDESYLVTPYSGNFMIESKSSESVIEIELDVLVNDSVSFYKKVSCEEGDGSKYDFLEFLIDDVSMEWWDGEDDWSYESFPVLQGIHKLSWRYAKDSYLTEGEDKAWIDYIKLPIHESNQTSDNNVPYFTSVPGLELHQKDLYEYIIEVADDDSDELEIKLFEAPEFLELTSTIDNVLKLSGTPVEGYNGDYTVILSVSDSKAFNHQIFTVNVGWAIDIDDVENKSFAIYPNPTKGILQVHLFNSINSDIKVYNSLGQQVYDYKIADDSDESHTHTLDLTNLEQGVYFIEISSDEIKETKRIVIN